MKHKLRRWIGKGNWFAVGTLPGVVLVGLMVAVLSVLVLGSDQRSPEEQIAADSPDGYSVELIRQLELRSAAETSYLVVLSRPEKGSKADQHKADPDEVRIYDQDGDDLSRSLTLRPSGLIPGRPTLKWHGIVWGNPQPRSYRYFLRSAKDFDRDGRAEVIGVFHDQASDVYRPVAIAWSVAEDRYVVSPLIPSQPVAPLYDSGGPIPSPAGWAQLEARLPLRVGVTPGGRDVDLYGASALEVLRLGGSGPVLITGSAALTTRGIRDLSGIGKRHTPGGGLAFQLRTAFESSPVVGRLTVDVRRLRFEDGKVKLDPCSVYATSRIRPGLVVPRLVVSALPKAPLDPQRIHLARHAFC